MQKKQTFGKRYIEWITIDLAWISYLLSALHSEQYQSLPVCTHYLLRQDPYSLTVFLLP